MHGQLCRVVDIGCPFEAFYVIPCFEDSRFYGSFSRSYAACRLVFGHWVLLFLGMKMIYEGWPRKGESEPCCIDPADTRTLVGLSLATSIDALAVGISFAFLNMTMITPTIVIAGVTFAFSLVGVYIGRQFGRRIHNFAEVVGGVILIGIGVKILLEHLFF